MNNFCARNYETTNRLQILPFVVHMPGPALVSDWSPPPPLLYAVQNHSLKWGRSRVRENFYSLVRYRN